MHIHVHHHDEQTARLFKEILKTMSDLSNAIDLIAADTAKVTSVVESTKVVIDGIRNQVADLTAQLSVSQDVPAAVAKLAELHTALGSATDSLSAAVVANTPAAPAAPVPLDPSLPVA